MSEQGSPIRDESIEVRDQVEAELVAGRAARRRDEPEKISAIDAEYLAGRRFDYQEDVALVEDVDLLAATPGADINWLEDIHMLVEDGVPAVFDRYSNSFLKIYFDLPAGREDELARKVLIKHLQSGNSYGIVLKEQHTKFPQPELGSWVEGSKTVGTDWHPSVLEGWETPAGH
ncbi:MAG: hypothetical protein H0X17_24330 [Deltaproteobacteria bacterium]|nr:hypothetical protein [Deltaproteobacteria bacterium]